MRRSRGPPRRWPCSCSYSGSAASQGAIALRPAPVAVAGRRGLDLSAGIPVAARTPPGREEMKRRVAGLCRITGLVLLSGAGLRTGPRCPAPSPPVIAHDVGRLRRRPRRRCRRRRRRRRPAQHCAAPSARHPARRGRWPFHHPRKSCAPTVEPRNRAAQPPKHTPRGGPGAVGRRRSSYCSALDLLLASDAQANLSVITFDLISRLPIRHHRVSHEHVWHNLAHGVDRVRRLAAFVPCGGVPGGDRE
jgi:hypothetical protein